MGREATQQLAGVGAGLNSGTSLGGLPTSAGSHLDGSGRRSSSSSAGGGQSEPGAPGAALDQDTLRDMLLE